MTIDGSAQTTAIYQVRPQAPAKPSPQTDAPAENVLNTHPRDSLRELANKYNPQNMSANELVELSHTLSKNGDTELGLYLGGIALIESIGGTDENGRYIPLSESEREISMNRKHNYLSHIADGIEFDKQHGYDTSTAEMALRFLESFNQIRNTSSLDLKT